ncbi:hypothetical protein PGTUg99_002753 [Puccinia graminis f. sp. tritici]|uniref:Uncharacterized protein n=1 Tax=Puccinia graminis f. sp. tritici TaxID=56615 RepID=A0A5B0QDR0_PUCGR|nr:hypothetical protein PGTUg99_002753 [Puccinia graminis f. sp. tritici]
MEIVATRPPISASWALIGGEQRLLEGDEPALESLDLVRLRKVGLLGRPLMLNNCLAIESLSGCQGMPHFRLVDEGASGNEGALCCMTADNPNSLGSRAHQRMSRINRRISVLPVPTVSNFSKRIHGITWQAYPVGLGTATAYILLANLKPHPQFLTHIEIGLFILEIIVFCLTTGLLVVQAVLYPRQFKRVALDPNKNSFIPTCVLVFATIIIGTVNYFFTKIDCFIDINVFNLRLIATRVCNFFKVSTLMEESRWSILTLWLALYVYFSVPIGITADELIIFFWIYVTVAILVAFTVLTIWFSSPRNPTAAMTPAWAFPVFPLLLTGVVTFNVLRIVPLTDPRAVSIFITGLFMFGAGAFMCIFYLAIFLLRIMTTGFLDGHQANGAFIAAGPPVSASSDS